MITLPMGRNGKDSGVPFGSAQERHTTVRGSLVSACEAGMKRTYFREGNAEHGLQELGKRWELGMVLKKRGKNFVQKMVIKETRFENRESR